ncbi:MAG: NAD(P)-dependent oxidoreductase [Sulfurimonas sp.]|nr:NAD(P)-dependent oxidoreductase [Sulfurimonas sp.]
MKVLVTGGTGFLGRNLVEYLQCRHELLVPDSNMLNLLDETSVDAFFNQYSIDIVIHAAGKPGHRNSRDPSGVFYADTRMYLNLMRNRESFDKLIITGSGAVYDIRKSHSKVKEEEWANGMPADEHGFFRYVTAHHMQTSSRIVDLRLFGVFGKYEDYAIRFISNAICKSLFDLPITIKQNRIFDYLYINDLLPVVDHFISYDAIHSEYNVTPDLAISLRELADIVLSVSGKDLPIVTAQEGMGLEYSGDNSRLKQEIPNMQFTNIDNAIAQLYEWYRMNMRKIDFGSLLTDK